MTKLNPTAKPVTFNSTQFDSQAALARHLSNGDHKLFATIARKISRLVSAGVTKLSTSDFPNAVLPKPQHDGKSVTVDGVQYATGYQAAKALAKSAHEFHLYQGMFYRGIAKGKFEFTTGAKSKPVSKKPRLTKDNPVMFDGVEYKSIYALAKALSKKHGRNPTALANKLSLIKSLGQPLTTETVFEDKRKKPVQINGTKFDSITSAAKAMNGGQTDYYDMNNSIGYIRTAIIRNSKQIKLI